MCGRFATKGKAKEIARELGVEEIDLPNEFNVAPTHMVASIVADPEPRWTWLRWGLIPSWAQDVEIGQKLINARSETIMQKPSFKSAFKRRRCLIPCHGYYEWLRSSTNKQPFFNTFRSDQLLVMGGIWEHWQSKEGTELETFSLLTTEASPLASQIHHRMPVILNANQWKLWLDHSTEDVTSQLPLLRPYLDQNFYHYKVSKEVNSVRNNFPELTQPIQDEPDLFPEF